MQSHASLLGPCHILNTGLQSQGPHAACSDEAACPQVKNHLYNPQSAFSYKIFDTRAQLQRAYLDLLSQIKGLMLQPSSALCAAVYTELSDVENEINGIMTYDRKYLRYDASVLSRAHRNLIQAGRALTSKTTLQ